MGAIWPHQIIPRGEFLQDLWCKWNQGPYTLPWEETTEIHPGHGSCGQSEILQDLWGCPAKTTEIFMFLSLTQHKSRQSINQGPENYILLNRAYLGQKLNPTANPLNATEAINNSNLISQAWIAITNYTTQISEICYMKQTSWRRYSKCIPPNTTD